MPKSTALPSPTPLFSANDHLRRFIEEHPGLLELVIGVHHVGQAPGGHWPEHCFVPTDLLTDVVMRETGLAGQQLDPTTYARVVDTVSVAAALAAWSMKQGIFTFDPEPLAKAPRLGLDARLPLSVLRRLPHPCVYVELSGMTLRGEEVRGAFAHVDVIFRTGEETLQILWDLGPGNLSACPLPLTGSLEDGFRRLVKRTKSNLCRAGRGQEAKNLKGDSWAQRLFGSKQMIRTLVNLLLFITLEDPDRNPRTSAEITRVSGPLARA